MLTAANSPRQTTTPSRVFTVPDDCSTDDNEPFDDEPIPTSSKNPTIIDLEEMPYTPRSPRTSIPQLDGVIDLVSEASDDESKASHVHDDLGKEGHGTGFHRRFHVDLLEDDYESLRLSDYDLSSAAGSVIGHDSMSDVSHHGVDSPSLSWDSLSSSSDDGHMDEDEGGDYDDVSAQGSVQTDIFMSDSESGGEDITRDDHVFQDDDDASVSSDVGQDTPLRTLFQLHPPVSQPPALDSQPSSQWLPPINSLIPSEQMGYIYTNTLEPDRPRLPSPSDAVLPHSNRLLETGDVEQQSTNDSDNAVPPAKNTGAIDGKTAAEALGQKSGKPEFFEAREHNKMAIGGLTEDSSRPAFPGHVFSVSGTSSTQACCVPMVSSVWPKVANYSWQPHGHEPVAHGPENEAPAVKPYSPGPSRLSPPEIHTSNSGTGSLIHQRSSATRTDSFELGRTGPTSSPVDYLAAIMGDAENTSSWEPASAWELQQKKRWDSEHEEHEDSRPWNLKEWKQPNQQDRDAESAGSSRPSFADVVVRKQNAVESHEDNLAVGTQKQSKGKRKAEMISEATEADMNWAASNSSRSPGESQATKEKDIGPSDGPSLLTSPPSPSARVQSDFPSPSTIPEATAKLEARPAKRIKKIAERVGYAALGGATVGAMVLTSLIYSAPTFV